MNPLQGMFVSILWQLVFYGTPLVFVIFYTVIRILPRRNRSIMTVEDGRLPDLYSSKRWHDVGVTVLVFAVILCSMNFIFPAVQITALQVSGIVLFGVGCFFLWRSDELKNRFAGVTTGKGSAKGRVKIDMKLPIIGVCIGILFFALVVPITLGRLSRYRLFKVQGDETAVVSFGWSTYYTFQITGWNGGVVSRFEVCWWSAESDGLIEQSNFTDVGIGKRYRFEIVYIVVVDVGSNYVMLLAEPAPSARAFG